MMEGKRQRSKAANSEIRESKLNRSNMRALYFWSWPAHEDKQERAQMDLSTSPKSSRNMYGPHDYRSAGNNAVN